MKNPQNGPFFHAYYREPSLLARKYCDHPLFPVTNKNNIESNCQFAKIDKYIFALTQRGLDMFKCFLDAPELLISKYGWNKDVIKEITDGEVWGGERLSFPEAMERMKSLADITVTYPDGSLLFLFSRNKVDFNVEVYSTKELNFIEGFIITSIDSKNYKDFFSLIVNEENIIEIECDYGLNDYPDDNPWGIRYDGLKLSFAEYEIYPK